ncbi:hypothetical protein ElyMa_002010500 [Elysia marginata]|uniref:Uncharacterized protein n=1 Tax=Elysia marginata TaxID=1093978 RepID=A0AAV4F4H8_9GAST|nr:hypothetical protein ElyMa_002010500 [Elysia marginata]
MPTNKIIGGGAVSTNHFSPCRIKGHVTTHTPFKLKLMSPDSKLADRDPNHTHRKIKGSRWRPKVTWRKEAKSDEKKMKMSPSKQDNEAQKMAHWRKIVDGVSSLTS